MLMLGVINRKTAVDPTHKDLREVQAALDLVQAGGVVNWTAAREALVGLMRHCQQLHRDADRGEAA